MAEAADDERTRRRVELLRLRFQGGLAIREIAARWNADAAKLHHEYATARDEFRAALRWVVAFHMPTAGEGHLDAACRELLGVLG
jgi:RNA polymerase sigma-70 factor (ECF subfamily)